MVRSEKGTSVTEESIQDVCFGPNKKFSTNVRNSRTSLKVGYLILTDLYLYKIKTK